MARSCELCGRSYHKAASRSHSNIKTLRRQHLNLQTKKIAGRRWSLCARCLKTLAHKSTGKPLALSVSST